MPSVPGERKACELPKPTARPGLRLLARAYGWRHYCRLTHAGFLGEDDLISLQSRKLARLLQYAFARAPYYREMVAREGIQLNAAQPLETLRELPLLTKADIMANFPDRLLAKGRRTLGSRHLTTTGTTSDRVDIVLDLACRQQRHGAELWTDDMSGETPLGARRLEIPPDACSQECGVNQDRPEAFWQEVRWAGAQSRRPLQEFAGIVGRRLRRAVRHALLNDLTLPPFGPQGTCIPEQRLQQYVQALQQERPYLLTGLATYLHQIARYLRRTGQRAPVPVVRPLGSLSTTLLKRFLAETFAGEVYESYGSNELGSIAVECAAHQWLHVGMVSHVVEILRDGKPAEEGQLGHLVVTCLDNYAMPLIRYQLGDVGRWRRGPCACGRRTQLIECNGRLQDLIVTAPGKPVTEEEVMDLLYFTLGWEQFQLVERRRGQFDLLVVPPPGQDPDLESTMSAARELLDDPRRLDVFRVDTIYPEATGKFRFVKSASYDGFV